jgi:hypothetical protein
VNITLIENKQGRIGLRRNKSQLMQKRAQTNIPSSR